MELITDISLWELVKHAKQWLINLRSAGTHRKSASVKALRSVIVAARHTSVYVRHLNETGVQKLGEEARLATKWTELSFLLSDLRLDKLAKRCDIKGRYWANPAQFEREYLEKADVGLESIEQLARQMLKQIER